MFRTKKNSLQLIGPKIIRLAVVDGIKLEQQDAKEIIKEAIGKFSL